jgi:hypothetical protein
MFRPIRVDLVIPANKDIFLPVFVKFSGFVKFEPYNHYWYLEVFLCVDPVEDFSFGASNASSMRLLSSAYVSIRQHC